MTSNQLSRKIPDLHYRGIPIHIFWEHTIDQFTVYVNRYPWSSSWANYSMALEQGKHEIDKNFDLFRKWNAEDAAKKGPRILIVDHVKFPAKKENS